MKRSERSIIKLGTTNQLNTKIMSWQFDKVLRNIKPGPFCFLCCLHRFVCEEWNTNYQKRHQNDEYEITIYPEGLPPSTQKEWANYMGISVPTFVSYVNTLKEWNIIINANPDYVDKLFYFPHMYVINDPSEWRRG